MAEKKRLRLPKVTDKQRAYARLRLKHPRWADWYCYQQAYDPHMSNESAMSNAWRMKENEGVVKYIKALRDRMDDEFVISQARIKQELSSIAFADHRDFYDAEGNLITARPDLPEHVKGPMPKATDKNKALETLTKMEGGFEKDNKQSQPVTILKPDTLKKPKESGK